MLKKILLTMALAGIAVPALAANQTIDLSSGSASFIATSPVLASDAGLFKFDTLTFTGLATGTYDFLLDISAQNITGLTATLNGQVATVLSAGRFSFASLESTGSTPFVLGITGVPGARALYSGDFSVTAVPEPETYAMMLAGLGIMGFVARRKNKN